MKNTESEDQSVEFVYLGLREEPHFDAIAKAVRLPADQLRTLYELGKDDEGDEEDESENKAPV